MPSAGNDRAWPSTQANASSSRVLPDKVLCSIETTTAILNHQSREPCRLTWNKSNMLDQSPSRAITPAARTSSSTNSNTNSLCPTNDRSDVFTAQRWFQQMRLQPIDYLKLLHLAGAGKKIDQHSVEWQGRQVARLELRHGDVLDEVRP